MTITRAYGWKQSKIDERDYKLKTVHPKIYKNMPKKYDLSHYVPEVLDQGPLSSCTAHAASMAHRIIRIKHGSKDISLSRLFIYFNERYLEGNVKEDAGAELRSAAKVLATIGVPPETDWPYVVSKFAELPIGKAWEDAIQNEIKTYLRVDQTLNELKYCLYEDFPFIFGAQLFRSFESEEVARTGIVPMPAQGEKPTGGHAILCVGYDDKTKLFKVLNSWGADWGDKGYCYFPYDYMTDPNLVSDIWTFRSVELPDPNRKWEIPKL